MEFFREPTTEEKKDFKPIPLVYRENNAQTLFKEKLEKKEKEFLRKKKPFCSRCARMDFKDEWDKKIKELERKTGYFKERDLRTTDFDLGEYGADDRFASDGDKDAMEPTGKADFSRGIVERKVKIGIHKGYRCKIRGCGISIFIPTEDKEEKKK